MYTATGVLLQNETRHLIILSENSFTVVEFSDIAEYITDGTAALLTRYCTPDITIAVYDFRPLSYSAKDAIKMARWYVNTKTRAARWN